MPTSKQFSATCLVVLAILSATARSEDAQRTATVRRLKPDSASPDWKVSMLQPDRFNAAGNLLVAYGDRAAGVDVVREMAAIDGSVVWECRFTPAGSLSHFVRRANGTTLVARNPANGISRVMGINRHGDLQHGLALASPAGGAPKIETLQSTGPERIFIAVRGYAFETDSNANLSREFNHPSVLNALSLSDGRILCTMQDPDRFVIYNPFGGAISDVPLDALCQVWDVTRAEEPAPGTIRLYGCFCLSETARDGSGTNRKTVEVLDLDMQGNLKWHYGTEKSLRINEFGRKRCATYIRGVIRSGPAITVLDDFPENCGVVDLDSNGEVTRRWLSLTPDPDMSVIGLKKCPTISIQRLGRRIAPQSGS